MLILTRGRVRWAVSQKRIAIRRNHVGKINGNEGFKRRPHRQPLQAFVFFFTPAREKSRITLVTHSTSREDFGLYQILIKRFHLLNYNLVFSLSIMSPSMIHVNSFAIVRRFKFHSIVPFVHRLPSSAIYRPLIMNKWDSWIPIIYKSNNTSVTPRPSSLPQFRLSTIIITLSRTSSTCNIIDWGYDFCSGRTTVELTIPWSY